MRLRVDYGGCENVPYRSPTARSIIDQGPQLLLSEFHGWIHSEATHLAGCSQPMTECGRETEVPGRWGTHLEGDFA